MTTRTLGRLGAPAASALLVLQLFAGVGQAAIPSATATNEALPPAYTDGNAVGFRTTLVHQDKSTISQLYLRLTVDATDVATPAGSGIEGGTITYAPVATRNGVTVAGACATTDAMGPVLVIDCSFRSIRPDDRVRVTVGVTPVGYTAGDSITASGVWSTTGLGSGSGDNSHGDTWTGAAATAFYAAGMTNYAGGFDTTSIATYQVVSSTNPQASRLASLPRGVPATVQDNVAPGAVTCVNDAAAGINCSALTGDWVTVDVGDGQVFGSLFQIQISFYSGSPKGFVHVSDVYEDGQQLIAPCAKRNPVYPCFTWAAKTRTATIFTYHNGSVRRF